VMMGVHQMNRNQHLLQMNLLVNNGNVEGRCYSVDCVENVGMKQVINPVFCGALVTVKFRKEVIRNDVNFGEILKEANIFNVSLGEFVYKDIAAMILNLEHLNENSFNRYYNLMKNGLEAIHFELESINLKIEKLKEETYECIAEVLRNEGFVEQAAYNNNTNVTKTWGKSCPQKFTEFAVTFNQNMVQNMQMFFPLFR